MRSDQPGEWLRDRRDRARVTQEELAEAAGVDARTIRDIERGRTLHPRPSTVRLLTDALAVLSAGDPRAAGQLVPRELPADTRGFVGRAAELAALDSAVDAPGTVCVVAGAAGVGKTALVVRWAHGVADRFPDGQVYLNLRGYDAEPPMTPAAALAALLRSLGVASEVIPEAIEERATRYRSVLAGRRVLVVLDNACDTEQVRHLLPGSSPSVALVTSRETLGGLGVRHGARLVRLDPLSHQEALELLGVHVGSRADPEPDALDTIARHCARLPLALRIAAQLAATRPALSLGELAGGLADEEERLDLLDAGDPHNSVHAVLSWSYGHLSPPAARLFRLLGGNPGPDIGGGAAAALAGLDVRRTKRLMAELTRAHMVGESTGNRFGMHDLLRAYAREQAGHDDEARRAATARLLGHYVAAAASAMEKVAPYDKERRGPLPDDVVGSDEFTDAADAYAWLERERVNLVACGVHAANHGWPEQAGHLSMILFRYLDHSAQHVDAEALHGAAARCASSATVGRLMLNHGIAVWRTGRYLAALDHYRQALECVRAVGDRRFEGMTLGNIGVALWRLGRDAEAMTYCRQAGELFRDLGDTAAIARTHNNIALLELRAGRLAQALDHQRVAIRSANDAGDRCLEADAWGKLGTTCHRLGRAHEAIGHYRRSLAMFRTLDDRNAEVETLNEFGTALLETGTPHRAIARHRQALRQSTKLGDRFEQARAHEGIAAAFRQLGDHASAGHHWRTALTLHGQLRTSPYSRTPAPPVVRASRS